MNALMSPGLKEHLAIEQAIHKARNTAWADSRDRDLHKVMDAVIMLPARDRAFGDQAAFFVASQAKPGGPVMQDAAEYLFAGIDRLRSNAQRFRRTLMVGGLTEPGPFQDKVADKAADLFRKIEARNSVDAALLAVFAQGGLGLIDSREFSEKLVTRLRPEPPAQPRPAEGLKLRLVHGAKGLSGP